MSLFSNLKEKLSAKLDEFKTATVPGDPLEKQAFELVQKATSETLISPDWNANLSCVDFINSDVRLSSGRVLRALKQSMAKPNGKVQSLTLTVRDGCCFSAIVSMSGACVTWPMGLSCLAQFCRTVVYPLVTFRVLQARAASGLNPYACVLQPPTHQPCAACELPPST